MMGFVRKPFVETVFRCISILSGLSGETGSLYMFNNDQMTSNNIKWDRLFIYFVLPGKDLKAAPDLP